MLIPRPSFNIYLLLALALCLPACSTEKSKRKKALATIRLHFENHPEPMGRTEDITVFRDHPVKVTVLKSPFLTEQRIKDAKVVDVVGGFMLQVQFDHEGTMLLEQYTSNVGRHIAIFSQFPVPPDEKLNKGRWLAAPKIQNHITDGRLSFTPDATREEADQIALGLSNVGKRLGLGRDLNFKD